MLQQKSCNASSYQQRGLTLKKCVVNCCEEDKCNWIGDATTSTSDNVTTGTPPGPTSDGCFNAASIVTILMSVAALFVGVFIH